MQKVIMCEKEGVPISGREDDVNDNAKLRVAGHKSSILESSDGTSGEKVCKKTAVEKWRARAIQASGTQG